VHNETLSIAAMRVCNPDRVPVGIAEMQPQLQPALLRLSAMISQNFMRVQYYGVILGGRHHKEMEPLLAWKGVGAIQNVLTQI
jgi:hypothetical protein